MLDELILLANGQIIYEGSEIGVRDFFQDVGFRFPEHANTGDVITDIITGNGRIYKSSGDISKEALIAHWASSRQNAAIRSRHESRELDSASVARTTKIQRQLLKQRGAPRWRQGWLCLRRAMLQQWRVKSTFWFEMGLASISGILLGFAENSKEGVLFTGIYKAPFQVLSVATDNISVPELALLIVIAVGLVSGAPGVKVFSEETLLYRREAEAGHSRIAYFLAKNVSVLPRMVFACLHFSALIFVLSTPIIPWGIAFVTNLAYFYCIYGLASVMSSKSTTPLPPPTRFQTACLVNMNADAGHHSDCEEGRRATLRYHDQPDRRHPLGCGAAPFQSHGVAPGVAMAAISGHLARRGLFRAAGRAFQVPI